MIGGRCPKMGQICPKPKLRTGGTGYVVMAVLVAVRLDGRWCHRNVYVEDFTSRK